MKCKQLCSGFELGSPCPFPSKITITLGCYDKCVSVCMCTYVCVWKRRRETERNCEIQRKERKRDADVLLHTIIDFYFQAHYTKFLMERIFTDVSKVTEPSWNTVFNGYTAIKKSIKKTGAFYCRCCYSLFIIY